MLASRICRFLCPLQCAVIECSLCIASVKHAQDIGLLWKAICAGFDCCPDEKSCLPPSGPSFRAFGKNATNLEMHELNGCHHESWAA